MSAPASYSFTSLNLVKTPSKLRNFCIVTLLITLFLILMMVLLPWQQYSVGTGKVIAYAPEERLQNILSPIDGRILKWFVTEGQRVKAGQALVELSDLDPLIMDRLKSELDSGLQKVRASEGAVEISRLNLNRQQELAKKGLVSQRAYELAQIEYNKMLSDLANATAELAQVEVRLSRQASQVVEAPIDGIVQRILGAAGSIVVKTGDSLMNLAPDNKSLAVELLVDGNDIPLITTGRKVRVQFEGWPAVQIIGWPSLAIGTFGGVVEVIDPADDGTGRFRVIVFQDPEDRSWPDVNMLRLGIRTNGWIILDRVKVWFELWRRFNGFPQSGFKIDEYVK